MRNKILKAAAMTLVLGASATALALPAPSTFSKPQHEKTAPGANINMSPAKKIESMPGANLSIRVGEKRSFKPAGTVGCSDPSILKVQVEKGIMTVYARKAGRVVLTVFNGGLTKPPTQIQTLVTE